MQTQSVSRLAYYIVIEEKVKHKSLFPKHPSGQLDNRIVEGALIFGFVNEKGGDHVLHQTPWQNFALNV